MGFVNRMKQNVVQQRVSIRMKKWRWSPLIWVIDVVFQGAWVLYRINEDEDDESLPVLAFQRHVVKYNFSEIFIGKQIILELVGIRNIPWDVCYDHPKHYQVQSEHRRTQSPFKHLRWSVFAQTVNSSLKSLTGYAKTLHLRCLKGVWTCLCWKTRHL